MDKLSPVPADSLDAAIAHADAPIRSSAPLSAPLSACWHCGRTTDSGDADGDRCPVCGLREAS